MTDRTVKDRLRKTCVLFDGTESGLGSGFIVARGYAATANHVVPDHEIGDSINVGVGWGTGARHVTAVLRARDVANDVALLQLENCDDIEPLPVQVTVQGQPEWQSFGFPKAASLDGSATGIPLDGRVNDAGWSNQAGIEQIILQCEQNQGRVSLQGVSGSAVVAEGALIALIVEEFKDLDNMDQAVFGLLKALPIGKVIALLPPGVNAIIAAAPQSVTAAPSPVDLPLLFSWCDRSAVVSRLNQWLEEKQSQRTGLLCIVGHQDNRPKLLVNRVADELSEQSNNPVSASSVWVMDSDPQDESEFRRAIHNSLGLAQGATIEQSPKLRGVNGLILLCQCCDFKGWSTRQVEQRMKLAAQWLQGLVLSRSRVIVVLAIRHEKLLPFVNAEKRVASAFDRAVKQCPSLAQLTLKNPLALPDYRSADVLDWAEMPRVRAGIGQTANRINGPLLEEWFRRSKTASHGKLLHLISELHDKQGR